MSDNIKNINPKRTWYKTRTVQFKAQTLRRLRLLKADLEMKTYDILLNFLLDQYEQNLKTKKGKK